MVALSPPSRPQVFAIMRNGHEVIRGCMRDVEDAFEEGDLVRARGLWEDLQRWDNLHMRMEEGRKGLCKGLFKVIDENADNIVTRKGLRHHHKHLYEFEDDIADGFANAKDVSEAVKASFKSFQLENLRHLEIEESVMSPQLQRMAKEGQPMKEIMLRDCLPAIPAAELQFFIQFANQTLVQHEQGKPRVRVFNHALWAIATPEQWAEWEQWIQQVLPEDKFNETLRAIRAWSEWQASGGKPSTTAEVNHEPVKIVDGPPGSKRGVGKGIKKLFHQLSHSISSSSSVFSASSRQSCASN